jgi:hypothetical protein
MVVFITASFSSLALSSAAAVAAFAAAATA